MKRLVGIVILAVIGVYLWRRHFADLFQAKGDQVKESLEEVRLKNEIGNDKRSVWLAHQFPNLSVGDTPYAGVPLNAAAQKVADAWDPAKDEAAGEQCRAYGAANIMRVPGRVRITWKDDQTLLIDSDAGMQTRVLSFGAPAAKGRDWQGNSLASWDAVIVRRGALAGLIPGMPALTGSLKVVTTNMRPGYLRKNGVPYSEKTVLTEYFDRVNEPGGDAYLIVTTTIEDPTYLNEPYLYSTHFKKQADATGWNPTPCSAR